MQDSSDQNERSKSHNGSVDYIYDDSDDGRVNVLENDSIIDEIMNQ